MSIYYWYVYIIRRGERQYSIGLTSRPDLRLQTYIQQLGAERLPLGYSYVEQHQEFSTARQREKELMMWNPRQLEKLICGSAPVSLRFAQQLSRLYESFGDKTHSFNARWRREQASWPAFFS